MTNRTLKHDIEFSLQYGYEISFEYKKQQYWIFYAEDGIGYRIVQTPDNVLFTSLSSDWTEALDQKVIDGKSINQLFDQIKFTNFIHDNRSEVNDG